MNAGSTTSLTASVTSTNGNWNGTSTFTAASGTPFSGVSVGDWASIYNDGTTAGAVYIAQVTAINSGGAGITVSTTAKVGTAPTSSATGRSCKIGGAWGSLAGPCTLSNTTLSFSARLNIQAASFTDAYAGGYRNFGMSGTASFPFWIRGFKTTPGDLDNDLKTNLVAGTDFPQFTFTGFGGLNIPLHARMSFVRIVCTTYTSAAVQISSGSNVPELYRCEIVNQTANAAAHAITMQSGRLIRCLLQATTTASRTIYGNNGNIAVEECRVIGGVSAIELASTGAYEVCWSLITGFTTNGVLKTTNGGSLEVKHNTIRGAAATNGINLSSASAFSSPHEISKNTISGCTNAVNSSGVSNNGYVRCYMNNIYNCTNSYVGLGDTPIFVQLSDSSDPYASSSNATPNTGGMGGDNLQIVPGESYYSAGPIGAIIRSRLIGFRA